MDPYPIFSLHKRPQTHHTRYNSVSYRTFPTGSCLQNSSFLFTFALVLHGASLGIPVPPPCLQIAPVVSQRTSLGISGLPRCLQIVPVSPQLVLQGFSSDSVNTMASTSSSCLLLARLAGAFLGTQEMPRRLRVVPVPP